jgi:phosphoribosylformimino-5-aminoimidazole carboxamide ribotide isomerase
MQVIPAVDVLAGRAVRLLRGDYGRRTEYGDDPVSIAEGFVSEGAELVHVIDLDAARGRSRSPELLGLLQVSNVPFQLGGGIRSVGAAVSAIDAGATRVVLGSALLAGDGTARDIVAAIGASAVVGAIDVHGGRARGSGWLDEGVPLADALATIDELQIERILVTGIETDGTMHGPAWELLERVRTTSPGLALIASGGVGSIEDVQALAMSSLRFEAAIVGRALYEGRFSVSQAIMAASG